MQYPIDPLEPRRLFVTFTVVNTADSGAGSLRDAIVQANATTAADVINFNIGGVITDTKMITLTSSLTITQPVTIDATTQPGYAGSPKVWVRKSGATSHDGFVVNAANSVIRGFSVTEFANGIVVNAANVTIDKNYIGLDPAGGNLGTANGDGIVVGTAGNFVNIRDNVISGNANDGVDLSADNARFTGNIIGLDPTGLLTRSNGATGIRVSANGDNLTLGDAGDANRNVLSANTLSGIRFFAPATNALIINNYFGLDKTGNVKFVNNGNAIVATGANGFQIGYPGLGNRFGGTAIDLSNSSSSNTITDNVMGVGIDPTINVGGTATSIVIGGTLNTITNNVIGYMRTGIDIEGSTNTITNNHLGTLPDGRNVGDAVGTGIDVSGSNNSATGNRIANFGSFGVKVNSGHNNSFDNITWANGQSYYYEATTNDNFNRPAIQNVFENANGTYSTNINYSVPTGNYQVKIYASDTAGAASSGHTQRLLLTTGFISTGVVATRLYTLPGAGLDSKYLTATLTEFIGSNPIGSTTIPSEAKLMSGSPNLAGSAFEFETKHTVRFDFTSVTNSSVGVGDLTIRNLDTLQTYSAETLTVSGLSYRWNRTSVLPDGRYEAVIPVGAVSNVNGSNKLAMTYNFYVLAGDADRDGTVGFNDLLVLAQNYNGINKTFSRGDFNYDTKVDFSDLLIIAQNYGQSMFSNASVIGSTSVASRGRRVVEGLI
jgi:hypothetical protein